MAPLPSVNELLGRSGSLPPLPPTTLSTSKLPSVDELLGNTPSRSSGVTVPPQHHGGGFFHDVGHAFGQAGHIVAKTTTGLGSDAVHAPGGFYELGKGAVVDVKNLPRDVFQDAQGAAHHGPGNLSAAGLGSASAPTPFVHTRANIAGMTDATIKSLTDPHYMAEHPDQTFLSLLSFASAGAGGAVRVSTALKLAKNGDSAGAVSALLNGVETKARTFTVDGQIRELHPSDSHLVRAFQAGHDRLVQRAITEKPTSRLAGYGNRRLGASEQEALRAQTDTRSAHAGVLARAGRSLDAPQQAALRAVAENTPPAARIQLHEGQIAAGVNPEAHAAEIAKLRAGIGRGLTTLDQHGNVVVNAVQHPKLAAVDKLLKDAGVTIDQVLEQTWQMTPEGIRTRIDAPGRLFAGAHYVEPTPARLGEVSPGLERQRAEVVRMGKLHEKALELVAKNAEKVAGPDDAIIGNRVVGGPVDRTVEKVINEHIPVTEDAARARKAELEKKIDAFHQQAHKTMFPSWSKEDAAEQARRNKSNGRFDRQQSGKTRSGKASGASAWKTQKRLPLVKQEQMDEVMALLDRAIEKNADAPHVKQYVADRNELEALHSALTPFPGEPVDLKAAAEAMGVRHVEPSSPAIAEAEKKLAQLRELDAFPGIKDDHYMDLVQTAARQIKWDKFPTKRAAVLDFWTRALDRAEERAGSPAPGAQVSMIEQRTKRVQPAHVVAPHGSARADRLGAALSVERDKLERMEAAHQRRIEPTGWVGGETAQPGRQHVGYYSTESMPSARGPSGILPPVAGRVRSVIRAKTFKGTSVLEGHVPDNTTGLVARNMSRVYKYLASDEFRRNVPGHDTRQSSRDVLVNTQELKNAKIPDDLRASLDGSIHTIDELHGHAEGFDAFRERILPGLFDKKSDAAVLEKTAPLGEPAPEGFKWVDRGQLAELASPRRTAPGPLARAADTINSAQTAATVYFKLGHVITRGGTNAMTNLVQGSLQPVAMTRAFRLWKQLSPLDRAEALGMAGHGSYSALPAEGVNVAGRVARSGASFFAHRIDAPSRFLSLAYEARKAGISDAAGFRQMLHDVKQDRGTLDPDRRSQLDRIGKEANRSAIAYNRLSPHDRNFLNRAIWFYPWIKGSTRFAGRSLLEHPHKSLVGGQAGALGEQRQQAELGVLPSYEQALFKVGTSGGLPLVTNLATVNPYETPAQITDALTYLLGKPTQAQQLSQNLNPALAAVSRLLFHLDAHGQPSKASSWQNLLEGLYASTPEAQLLQRQFGIGGHRGSKMFPETPNYAWLHFLLGSPTPRRIDPGAAARSAYYERRDAGIVK